MGSSETLHLADLLLVRTNKVASDLNVASHLFKSKGSRVEILDGKMAIDGRYVVNGNFELVDTITSLLGDTATIFQGDTRISTTVKKEDGSRAVGTQAAANVVDRVLKEGRRYIGRAWVVDAWYVTAYEPIRDPSGKVVGMLYVGLPEKPFIERAEAFRDLTILVGFIALIIAQVAAFLLARSISNPIRSMTRASKILATGEIEQKIELPTNRGDELGEMATAFTEMVEYIRSVASTAETISHGDLTHDMMPRSERDVLGVAFQKMIANLRQMVTAVFSSAEALAQSSQQLDRSSQQAGSATDHIASTIQQVAQSSHEQAASIQEASVSLEQLSRAIDQIAEGAQEQAKSVEETTGSLAQLSASIAQAAAASQTLSSSGQEVAVAANSGTETVQKSALGMKSIQMATSTAAAKIQELNGYSDQIGAIVEAIDDIADQTNLLALNAAIEAARAGEHGRGFAVVADEVRKLAERSSQQTKQIAGLIARVQTTTQEAVDVMNQGAEAVEVGSRLAQEAGQALQNILNSVQKTNQQVTSIASAVTQMDAASQKVVSLMDGVSAVAEESTAATEEMAASSRQVIGSVERVATVSQETSGAAEQVSASTQEMAAQVEEVVSLSSRLSQMAEQLQDAISNFRLVATKVRCWDIRHCDSAIRSRCAAYQSEENRCWLIPNTWCGGVQQGDMNSKRHRCMNCQAYKAICGIGGVSSDAEETGVVTARHRKTDWRNLEAVNS